MSSLPLVLESGGCAGSGQGGAQFRLIWINGRHTTWCSPSSFVKLSAHESWKWIALQLISRFRNRKREYFESFLWTMLISRESFFNSSARAIPKIPIYVSWNRRWVQYVELHVWIPQRTRNYWFNYNIFLRLPGVRAEHGIKLAIYPALK